MVDAGLIVLVSFISPFRSERRLARGQGVAHRAWRRAARRHVAETELLQAESRLAAARARFQREVDGHRPAVDTAEPGGRLPDPTGDMRADAMAELRAAFSDRTRATRSG